MGIRSKVSLPGLADVDHIDAVRTCLPEVWLHVDLQVLRAQVTLCCQKHLNVLGRGVEDRGEIVGCHTCGPGTCDGHNTNVRREKIVVENMDVLLRAIP